MAFSAVRTRPQSDSIALVPGTPEKPTVVERNPYGDKREPENSRLPAKQIFHLHAVAPLDDLGNPLPMAMPVIALVAENADRP